jgi:type II secretory pathway pseudopilin PulG
LHFHLPKPLHGWREFVGEVGIIVIGVLIALGAEQLIETLHWQQAARQASHAIQLELAAQQVDAAERLAVQPCLTGQLNALAARLSAFRGGLWKGMPMIVHQEGDKDAQQRTIVVAYRAPERLWVSDAWQTARSNGSLNHLPDSAVSEFAREYNRGNRLLALQMQENEAASRLAALAVDGPIGPSDRVALLGELVAVDRANAGMAYQAKYLAAEVEPLLRDVPRAKIDHDVAEMVKEQRAFRGSCVRKVDPGSGPG